MFDFRNGMLGVVVVAVAIGAALFASYFAGIESVEHDVVKYNELADVTGLFDTETSPQYVDYDPSSNYTGYYSEESYSDIDNKYYFAEDQVYYKPNVDSQGNTRVNNYKIEFIPETNSGLGIDLDTISPVRTEALYYIHYYYDETHHVDYYGYGSTQSQNYPTTLKSLIESMSLASNWDSIRISLGSDVNWDDTPTGGTYKTLNLNTILIIPKGQFVAVGDIGSHTSITSPNRSLESIVNPLANGVYHPCLSFEVNIKTWEVQCYSDYNFESKVNAPYMADSMIVFEGDSQYGLTQYNELNLDSMMKYSLIQNKYDYLNPNYGVSLMDPLPSETVSALTLRSYAGGTYQITNPILEIESERSGSNYYFGIPSTVRLDVGETENVNIYKRTDGDWFLTHVTVTIERVDP